MKFRINKKALAACVAVSMGAMAFSGSAVAASGTIKLAFVEWDSCVAATNVVADTLRQAGYKVQTLSVSAGAMYVATSTGDVDGFVCAWLPNTHKDYYAKTKDKLVNLGNNQNSAKLGLVVPDYVKINSIEGLKDPAVSKKFQDRIVGIDPGAGIMRLAGNAIKDYGLPEKLVSGSGAAMTAVLGNEIRQHKDVVVTGWTPHWMFARWKLKFLKDPKGSFGKPDHIQTLVRKGLKKDKPEAYAILDKFYFGAKDRGAVMQAARKSKDPKAAAAAWVKDHQKTVDSWMGK